MNKTTLYFLGFFVMYSTNHAQVLLDANGAGNTYEEITAVLAPGYDPVEEVCNHSAFGRHIDEIWDATLSDNVFRFIMHLSPDDNKCVTADRQRNEIKTYDQSPDNLLGVTGETVEYKWKFKLDAGFQSSPDFTHIHQLKAVGGTESSMPLITLTTRYGSSNDKLQLRYAETTSQTTIHEVDLTPFKGVWVEVTETVTYGEMGSGGAYDIEIIRVSDSAILMSYTDADIRMWKTSADFIRPKWGIYRKNTQTSYLRDEEVLFADFSIDEGSTLGINDVDFQKVSIYPNPARDYITIRSNQTIDKIVAHTILGNKINLYAIDANKYDISNLKAGIYLITIKSINGNTITKKVVVH